MSGVKVTTVLEGFDRLARELKLAVPETKARVVAAIRKNTQAVASKAKVAAPRRSGTMAGTIRDEYSDDGLVGFIKVGFGKLPRRSKAFTAGGKIRARRRNRTLGPGAQAPIIERGDPRRNRKPEPFLNPSLASQRPTVVNDVNTALNRTVQDIANG